MITESQNIQYVIIACSHHLVSIVGEGQEVLILQRSIASYLPANRLCETLQAWARHDLAEASQVKSWQIQSLMATLDRKLLVGWWLVGWLALSVSHCCPFINTHGDTCTFQWTIPVYADD